MVLVGVSELDRKRGVEAVGLRSKPRSTKPSARNREMELAGQLSNRRFQVDLMAAMREAR